MTRKCSLCRQEGHQRNHCSNSPFGGAFVHSIKSVDDTPLPESENELTEEEIQRAIRFLIKRVGSIDKWIHSEIPKINRLEAEVADLHHRRRVSRQQAVDQDPEWH